MPLESSRQLLTTCVAAPQKIRGFPRACIVEDPHTFSHALRGRLHGSDVSEPRHGGVRRIESSGCRSAPRSCIGVADLQVVSKRHQEYTTPICIPRGQPDSLRRRDPRMGVVGNAGSFAARHPPFIYRTIVRISAPETSDNLH